MSFSTGGQVMFQVSELKCKMLRNLSTQLSRCMSSSTSPSTLPKLLNVALNDHIHQEVQAAFVYFGMHAWFQRPDVALKGFSKFFLCNYREEWSHAELLISYQVKRGGTFRFSGLPCNSATTDGDAKKTPEAQFKSQWDSPVQAIVEAIKLEEELLEKLLCLQRLSQDQGDSHLADFLTFYIKHQIDDISEKTEMKTTLERAGNNAGLYMFDRKLLQHVTAECKCKLSKELNSYE